MQDVDVLMMRRGMLAATVCGALGVGQRQALALGKAVEFTDSGETFLNVEFPPNLPLGLDLTEVRQSAPNGGNAVAIKRVQSGSVAQSMGLSPTLVLISVQGVSTFMKSPRDIIKFVQEQKKKQDEKGKELTLVFSRGYCYYPELRQFCEQ